MTAQAYAPSTRFELPDDLTATEPPEHRGLSRDGVRLLVAESVSTDASAPDVPARDGIRLTHSRFRELGRHLRPGDLVVVNTSKTVAGELDGLREGNWPVVLHVASPLPDGSWVIELRTAPDGTLPLLSGQPGEVIRLAAGARLRLLAPYPEHAASPTGQGNRLWRAEVSAASLSSIDELCLIAALTTRPAASSDSSTSTRPSTRRCIASTGVSGSMACSTDAGTSATAQRSGSGGAPPFAHTSPA